MRRGAVKRRVAGSDGEAGHLSLDATRIGLTTGLHARLRGDLGQHAVEPNLALFRGEGPLARVVVA